MQLFEKIFFTYILTPQIQLLILAQIIYHILKCDTLSLLIRLVIKILFPITLIDMLF